MTKIIRFSRFFLPAAIISAVLVIAGIAGYAAFGGFNLGIDFQAGLIQEVQIAPTAFSLSWSGGGDARISFDQNGLYIVVTGAGLEPKTHSFPFSAYRTVGSMCQGLNSQVEGLNAQLKAPANTDSSSLVFSAQGNPRLETNPYAVHYRNIEGPAISITQMREALASIGETVSVQNMGKASDHHFMIRVEDRDESGEGGVSADQIVNALESNFGVGEVVALRSDFVGSRFSKNLTDQAGILLTLTLVLILLYASIRFKPQYAIGAVLAILHDALIIVAFVVWTRMEFNTTTIAAILTILGYSINDTIVVFDRIRENRRIYPNDAFVDVMDRSLTETLSRTIITTVTTMFAVMFLFIFTSGSMKDFALALLVGMISGVYSTIFIASGFVNLWEVQKLKKEKRTLTGQAAKIPATAKA